MPYRNRTLYISRLLYADTCTYNIIRCIFLSTVSMSFEHDEHLCLIIRSLGRRVLYKDPLLKHQMYVLLPAVQLIMVESSLRKCPRNRTGTSFCKFVLQFFFLTCVCICHCVNVLVYVFQNKTEKQN